MPPPTAPADLEARMSADDTTRPADERRQLLHVQQDLAREFTDLPRGVVEAQFAELVAGFAAARVRTYVPVLVQRQARERLRQFS